MYKTHKTKGELQFQMTRLFTFYISANIMNHIFAAHSSRCSFSLDFEVSLRPGIDCQSFVVLLIVSNLKCSEFLRQSLSSLDSFVTLEKL